MTPLYGVILGFTFSTDLSVMSLLNTIGIKPEYMPRAAVKLVNIFNCLAYDWMVKYKGMIYT